MGWEVTIASAQFEHADGDKRSNLAKMINLCNEAKDKGADLVAFHECCLTGYTHLQHLDNKAILALAEPVWPPGPAVSAVMRIAKELGIAVGAGLLEREEDPSDPEAAPTIYNTYFVVDSNGKLAGSHRKLHAFISPHVSSGSNFTVFELFGAKIGILICYDNNLPENGRKRNPMPLRREFNGLKGREWIMRFVPCRAWENGYHAVFANAVGLDGDTVKPGISCVVDAEGNVLDECNELGDGIAVATLTSVTVDKASGPKFIDARRPELYGSLAPVDAIGGKTTPGWIADASAEVATAASPLPSFDGAASSGSLEAPNSMPPAPREFASPSPPAKAAAAAAATGGSAKQIAPPPEFGASVPEAEAHPDAGAFASASTGKRSPPPPVPDCFPSPVVVPVVELTPSEETERQAKLARALRLAKQREPAVDPADFDSHGVLPPPVVMTGARHKATKSIQHDLDQARRAREEADARVHANPQLVRPRSRSQHHPEYRSTSVSGAEDLEPVTDPVPEAAAAAAAAAKDVGIAPAAALFFNGAPIATKIEEVGELMAPEFTVAFVGPYAGATAGMVMDKDHALGAFKMLSASFPNFTFNSMKALPVQNYRNKTGGWAARIVVTGKHEGTPFTPMPGKLPAIEAKGLECTIGPELFTMWCNEEGKATKMEIEALTKDALVGPPGFYVLVGGKLPPKPQEQSPSLKPQAGAETVTQRAASAAKAKPAPLLKSASAPALVTSAADRKDAKARRAAARKAREDAAARAAALAAESSNH
eukprot:gene10083-7820_t